MLQPKTEDGVPRARSPVGSASPDAGVLPVPPSAAEVRILVVDDDDGARRAVEALLRAEGFSTSAASDGAAALAEARRDPPDLVITDLQMPGMNGIELCRHLQGLRAEVEDYLTKPLDAEVLLLRIERTLERRAAKASIARLAEERTLVNERLVLSSIREQESAEAAEYHRAQLSALLGNLNDGVLMADGAGRIQMVNRVARELWFGELAMDDVRELDALDVRRVDGTPLSAAERPLRRALRGEVFEHCEFLTVRADDVRRMSASGANVRGEDGDVALAIVVFRDVTELCRLERQRDEYIALISHDLRGPLGNILMGAELLESLGKDEPFDRAQVVDRIARNARRMNEMIAELLESASLDSRGVKLRKEPCDLGAIVTDLLRDMDDARRRRIVFAADGAPARLLADPPKIGRAIMNVIGNALKYSPGDAPVRVTLGRQGDDLVLEVVDRGIGIAEAHLPRLFERYYRAPTEGRFPGSGLGLYIAGLVVEAHGGRIDVASEVGNGSTFRVVLPSPVAAA